MCSRCDTRYCERCGALWQWSSLCKECIRLEDKAASLVAFKARGPGTRTHRTARGLHDHERAAKTPRKQTGVN